MFEPITLAKVRKATTVKVPAGGWIIVCTPEQPLSEHIAKRAEVVRKGNVSDEFEKILIGRIQSTHSNAVFVTTDEQKAREAAQEKFNKGAEKANDDAKAREKELRDAAAKKEQEAHDRKVAALNRQHDAIRTGKPVEPEAPAKEEKTEGKQ